MVSLARILSAVLFGGALTPVFCAEPPPDRLAAGFIEPPPETRPLVFWQWVNGNVTQDGIRLDLEWMQRVGLGGALMFDIGFRNSPVPQYVEHRVGYGTREWEQAVRFAASEAARLGLELGAQSSGGWSVSGGPQVEPEQAMKKLVWSETLFTPTSQSVLLPLPPSNNGPYQDVPVDERFREPSRYGDIAVIAYRLPDTEQSANPGVILKGASDVALLDDGRYSQATELAADAEGNAFLFAHVTTDAVPRAITLAVRGVLPEGAVESSADGDRYESVIELPGNAAQPAPVRTFALPERTGKYWRIRFRGLTRSLPITEARFEFGARVDLAQEKAGYGVLADYVQPAFPTAPSAATIHPRDVMDLSAQMQPDGTLSWRPREGRWIAVRFGWSLTGRRVVPATPESIGLEVDKLDPKAVRSFANAFYDRYLQATGNAGQLHIALTDSWEAGQQNWTPAMFARVRRTARIRPASMDARTHRPCGRRRRTQRTLPDGFPAHDGRHARRESLRRPRRRRATTRHAVVLGGRRYRLCPPSSMACRPKAMSMCRWANTGSTPKAGNRKPITSPMFARPRPPLTPMDGKSSRPKL